ncbi:BglG family transcription antiterminator [Lactiplantibacillus pentosus]|uniref:BglG family transcription antiterminator n=1 Tax=Lactiplantibacillus pentosus TaxID=1589 RepID=UPI001C1F98C5|nr:HTH domain-containing protein [Lactiplantibacillus pentosus]MBU7502182.1 HTH domain-containing protein [Lactiplantibacillus pentosus]MDY1544459.1 helix-turn-helix domain-containing protein [Lactiplantibacillus pentosus]
MNRQNFEMLNFFINNDALTLREIRNQFALSRSTIIKNVRDINEYLNGIAKINMNGSKFYLIINNYAEVAKVQTFFLKRDLDFNDPDKRQVTILKELIKHLSNYLVIDDLADSLAVSHGTLTNDLKELKAKLTPYGITIQAKTNRGIRLAAARDYELAAVTRNLVGKYYELELTWKQQTDVKLVNLIKQLDASDNTVSMIKRNIAVVKWLQQCDIRIDDQIKHYTVVVNDSQTQPLRELVTTIVGQSPTTTEWAFIAYPLSIKKLGIDDPQLITSGLSQIGTLMKAIFPKIKAHLDVQLDFQRLLTELQYHLLFLINRAVFHVETENFISNDMLNKYPVAAELASETVAALSTRLQLQIKQQEVGYLAVYFQMELEEYMTTPIIHRIALVKPFSESMKKFLSEQLTTIVDEDLQIDVFNSEEALRKSPEKYLLIFSNQLITENELIQRAPVIHFNSILNQGILRQRLQISLVADAISQGLCQFTVTHFNKAIKYMNAVEQLIETEIDKGQLLHSFIADWKARERKSSNIFGDGVALPHVIDNSGLKRILVTVGLFKMPTSFDGQKVRVVFLVAIPKQLDANLSRVLSQVYDLIRSIAANGNIYNNLKNYDSTRSIIQLMEAI